MKKLSILLLAAILLFAGCSSGSTDSKQSGLFGSGKGTATSSSSGSGVDLEFAEGNPPTELFKGQPVNFAFIFKNNQEHNVENLQLKVSGFDTGFVTGLDSTYSVSSIPRASETIGPGTYSGLVVSGVKVDGFEGNFNFNPVFDYCYLAKTRLVETVCVPSTTNQCKTEFTKDSKQNGPVSVAVQKINSIGDKVQVTFSISNKGSGEVVNECFNTQDYATTYSINSIKLGTSQGTCTPTGTDEFLMGEGKGNFYCEFARTTDESYATQITAELEYSYQQQTKKQFKVIDPTL